MWARNEKKNCHCARQFKISHSNMGEIVQINCVEPERGGCMRFVAAQLFDTQYDAREWAKGKLGENK